MILINFRKFGYLRVNSKDQNEEQQKKDIKGTGIDERDIFIDKQIGKEFDQDQYQVLKRMLRKGDRLYLHSLNHFGRNIKEILQEWNDITKNIQADIVVLDIPLLDTSQCKERTFIADLVLQLLSWMVQEERDQIRKSRRKGKEEALQNGKTIGRPKVKITEEFEQVYLLWRSGEITAVKAMQEIGVKKTTFYKLVKEYENS